VTSSAAVTQLLLDWRSGNASALDRLMPLVYDELHAVAARAMAHEAAGHTLQPTALVHEAYLRLVDAKISWQDRAHFFAVAARVMRRILVDHAKGKRRAKRGGNAVHVSLRHVAGTPADAEPITDLLDLDRALSQLSEQDERKGHVVELRFFGGLTHDEIANVLDISPATVHRDLDFATAWLFQRLVSESENHD
jgi:RNA polymerase sigma factor (TIGR02999 family)